jgi:tetratricopeptide (TPR) repeat protein
VYLNDCVIALLHLLLGAVLVGVLHAQPDATEQFLQQAIGLHQAGDINGAIAAYQKYLAARPESFMALSNLGAAYAHVARYEDAVAQYRHALKLQPGNVRIELNLSLAYYKTGRKSLAAVEAEKVHRAEPNELQPALVLADCWLSMGKNKEVVELIAPFSTRTPDDLALAYLLGTALVRDNQVERGQKAIAPILRNGDSAESHLLLGTTRLNARDYPAALADLKRAVELNPHLPDVYSFLGLAQLGAGDPAAATESFRNELAANPQDYISNLQLGILTKKDEKFDEAAAYLHRALDVRPVDVRTRFQIASLDLAKGKPEVARRELEAIIKEVPAYVEAHVTLATVYYRLKLKDEGDRERATVQKLNREVQEKQQRGINVK